MKVSARSWHVRLVQGMSTGFDHQYVPRDLCSHFWWVVASLAFVALCFSVFVVGAMLILFLLWIKGFVVLLPLVGGALVGHLATLAARALVRRVHDAEPVPRPPNLFVEYVKSKKHRICPLIEVVE